jgi:hypothetical protein
MRDKPEALSVPCELCGVPTAYVGTKRCNRCWELERRIQADLELAKKILSMCKPSESAKRAATRIWETFRTIDLGSGINEIQIGLFTSIISEEFGYYEKRKRSAIRKAGQAIEKEASRLEKGLGIDFGHHRTFVGGRPMKRIDDIRKESKKEKE